MGIFSKIFGQAKELTKLSNAVVNIKNFLDTYEGEADRTYLLGAAWMCKAGVLDLIVQNNWLPNYTVFVPINGHQTRMRMTEVQMHTIYRLQNKVAQLNDAQLSQTINDILDGGEAFWSVDAQIPQSMKDLIS